MKHTFKEYPDLQNRNEKETVIAQKEEHHANRG